MIPLETVPTTRQVNPRYQAELDAMCRACETEGAVLVWFDSADVWFSATRQRFDVQCGSLQKQNLPDAIVYRAPAVVTRTASPAG